LRKELLIGGRNGWGFAHRQHPKATWAIQPKKERAGNPAKKPNSSALEKKNKMLNESGLVYKYFDLIDGFIRVRILNDEETLSLPRGSSSGPPDRREYRGLVVSACVAGLEENVLPRVKEIYPDDAAAAEDLLYQICVDVNPRLEIHTVALPAVQEASAGELSPEAENDFRERADELQSKVLKEVIGQDEHVAALCRSVRKAAVGLKDKNRPIGSYLMVGLTGVGKTELAKAMARNMFGEDSLIRIDCSEFALPHETAKLIGAPPGYVGHNEGGTLTEALLENPHTVVLFDEIEKGHEKLHNMLLQILDDGRLTDSKGTTVSFSNALVLMTSNVGTSDYAEASNRLGFGSDGELEETDFRSLTNRALRQFFKPELLNRLDGIQIFGSLDLVSCGCIAEMKLREVEELVSGSGISLDWSVSVPKSIADIGFNPEYGAREVRRTVAQIVEAKLTDGILDGTWKRGDALKLSWSKGELKVNKKKAVKKLRKSA